MLSMYYILWALVDVLRVMGSGKSACLELESIACMAEGLVKHPNPLKGSSF